MRIRPDTLADGGCWISDDRVYAMVTVGAHGVAEIGYHGLQPVSRNSRVFVHSRAVIECSVISGDGRTTAIPFDELEWEPGAVRVSPVLEGQKVDVEIRVTGKRLTISFSGSGGVRPIALRIPRGSLFVDVQGDRQWEVLSATDGVLRLSFRDTITFNSWIRRSGPYSGDFLIPEPWRRMLFLRNLRSGEATIDDVRPEYRDAPLRIYDATTCVSIGGEGLMLAVEEKDFVFTTPARRSGEQAALFEVNFDAAPPARSIPAGRTRGGPRAETRPQRPRLTLSGHPHIEAFFAMLPDVVDSCVIRDYGVPRATPGRYYWIWAWDLMVTAVEMLRWGDLEGARRALRFVTSHRDIDGCIPGRWTRDLLPLDTPEEGAGLEFLLAHLSYELFLESRRAQDVLSVYPSLVHRFRILRESAGADGLIRGRGFYPDLPSRYGRSDHTATAIESGCWYGFCRILQNLALALGDTSVARDAGGAAGQTRESFSKTFWDPARGALQDAVDMRTGAGTGRHPVFSYLCLQSPLAFALISENIPEIARFVRRELLTEYGLRTVPFEERGDGAEVILDAWYPHWDLYALRILRKAGDAESSLRWLSLAETALKRLGYCPEFLALEGFRTGDPAAWTKHGAPSNLNCATGWYRALLETLFGLELDPGGITLSAAAPVQGRASVQGLPFRQGMWDITLVADGPSLARCLVDGIELGGVRKIPRAFDGPGRHRLELQYGPPRAGIVVEELVNAEVLQILHATPDRARLRIRLLGPGEILVSSPNPVSVRLDGRELPVQYDRSRGSSRGELQEPGEHDIEITV